MLTPALLLLALTAVRLVVAATAPLAPDETYYWVWSRALQPGYLDHPPMVALWIRLGTTLAGSTALGVRLLGPLAGLVGSVLLADAAERLFPGRRLGVASAGLLNATLMMGAGVVTMTPDTPLLLFAVATLWALARVRESGGWWLVAGVSAGLALDSKYTGVLLLAGAGLWLLWARPSRWLASAWPWAGAALALLLFAPVILWNAEVGWVSFAKQGGRTGDWHPGDAVRFLSELFGAQLGLATPPIFLLFTAGLLLVSAGALRREPAPTLLAALAVPGLLIFVQHAVGGRVQANWLAILYPPLAIAGALAGGRWVRSACGLGVGLTAVVYLQATLAVFPLPRRFDPTLIRLAGWRALAQDADALRRAQGVAFLASEDYGEASELAWWAPPATVVVGAEPRWRLFRLARPRQADGLLLISDRRSAGPDRGFWTGVTEVGHLDRSRGGVEAEGFRVYRVTLRTGAQATALPRPERE